MRVPDALRARVGVLEIRRSLRVHTASQARPLALKYAARVIEAFEMIQQRSLPRSQARDLIAACFHERGVQGDANLPYVGNDAAAEHAEQSEHARAAIRNLEAQASTGPFDAWVKREARGILEARGSDPMTFTPSTRLDLLSGVTRLLIEEQRRFLFRLDERLLPYHPSDPLFGDQPEGAYGPGTNVRLQPVGPTVDEVVTAHLKAKSAGWATKTAATRSRQLSYMAEHLGKEVRVSQLTAKDIAALGDAISRLRKGHHTAAAKSFASRQTDDPSQRISAKTASLIFEACKGAFSWAKRRGLIGTDPATGVELDVATIKVPKGIKARLPFDGAALETLFSSPLYAGHQSAHQRFKPGSVVTRDAKYWVPLIGLYTGMRLGEIIQLTHADVRLEDDIPHLLVTEVDESQSGVVKHVKTAAGVRAVPVHPDLLALGFAQFCADREHRSKGKGRLFCEVSYGADGMPSTVFSKWFGRALDQVGARKPCACVPQLQARNGGRSP